MVATVGWHSPVEPNGILTTQLLIVHADLVDTGVEHDSLDLHSGRCQAVNQQLAVQPDVESIVSIAA